MKYLDDDNELVDLASDIELHEAFRVQTYGTMLIAGGHFSISHVSHSLDLVTGFYVLIFNKNSTLFVDMSRKKGKFRSIIY